MCSPFVFDSSNDIVTGTAPARLDVCGFSCLFGPFSCPIGYFVIVYTSM